MKVAQWSDRLKRFEESSQTVTAFYLAEGVSCPSGKRVIADFAASGGRLLGRSGFGFGEHT